MKHYTCDVLIVGCGAAGLTSALAALEAGASVIVLERSPAADRGGNTRWTEAILRLRGGGKQDGRYAVSDDFVPWYAEQSGYHIAPSYVQESTQAYETWSPALKTLPFLDPELLDAFATSVPDTLAWLEGHGIKFHPVEYPFIFPAPLYGIYGGGLALIETLCPLVEQRGATILYEMTAVQFLLDEDLGVAGVKAVHSNEGAISITAKKTILACGGFEGNPAMTAQYMGPNARFTRPTAPGGWYNKGEGIRLALDIGAAPAGDFAECHRQPIDPRSSAAETRPSTSAVTRGRRPSTVRGVNAVETRRRSRVWSGGSMSMSWRRWLASNGACHAGGGVRPNSWWVATCTYERPRRRSRSSALTSENRATSHWLVAGS